MTSDVKPWPLASSTWDEAELAAINEVVDSGFFTMGSKTREFESKFASWANRKYAVMVNSGSSANLIAAAAMHYIHDSQFGQGREDTGEVIVPAVSWGTTFFPFYQNRYKLVFVDVDPETFNIDPAGIRQAISANTRGICGVNLLGETANWNDIKKIADEFNLWTVEDNCESMGSAGSSGLSGTLGNVSTFSFFYSHHICTMEGGAVVCDDEETYEVLRSLRAHGWGRDLPIDKDFLGEKRMGAWEENFRFYLPGFNVRPLEISAAIGIKQIEKMPHILELRRKNAKLLIDRLSQENLGWKVQQSQPESSWFTFAFVHQNTEKGPKIREKLISLLTKNGIQSRPIVAGNFTRNPVMKYLNYRINGTLNAAELIHNNGLMIGNHAYDLSENFDQLIKLLHESEIE